MQRRDRRLYRIGLRRTRQTQRVLDKPEAFGDLGLRQAQLLADTSEARADEKLLSGIGCHGSR